MATKYILALTLSALATTATARTSSPSDRGPTEVDAILACRAIAETSARLACYDGSAAKLSDAVAKKNVVIINREKAREASRSVFGFSTPNFAGLFGGGEQIASIESTVTGFGRNANGGLIVTLADGGVWSQTDDAMSGDPRRGDKVVVKRGVLGSYFLSTPRVGSFKAKRVG